MRQKLIVSAVASAVLSSVVPAAFAVPSTNCPASSGGVITIPNGLAVCGGRARCLYFGGW